MSLIEILVVLSIIALISGVIAVAVVGHLERARISTSRQSAFALRGAVNTFRLNHAADECPTVDMLVAAHEIDKASKTLDAWDMPFVVKCDEQGDVSVLSGGPDKRVGTPDDIRAPEPPAPIAQH